MLLPLYDLLTGRKVLQMMLIDFFVKMNQLNFVLVSGCERKQLRYLPVMCVGLKCQR